MFHCLKVVYHLWYDFIWEDFAQKVITLFNYKLKQFKFYTISALLFVVVFGLLSLVNSHSARARLGLVETEAVIFIDGVSYGVLDGVYSLSDIVVKPSDKVSYTRISLNRDFVTEPSFAHLARSKSFSRSKFGLVQLRIQTIEGDPIVRYEFKNCKPISWVIEKAAPSIGGFHEKIELSVQKVEFF